MATRMQQRRGTAQQWTTANPILAAGEIGFETDNNRFKIGNGATAWTALDYFANSAALNDLLAGAPEALNTLNELAAAMGDDPAFLTAIGTNLANHAADTTGIHGIADTSVLVTTTDLSAHTSDSTSVHGISDTANLVYLAATQTLTGKTLTTPTITTPSISNAAFSGNTTGITQSMVGLGNVDNTSDEDKEISIATQAALDLKLASTTAASTYAPLANATLTGTVVLPGTTSIGNVDSTEIGYLEGVTNAIQTQLDARLSKAGGTMTGNLVLNADPSAALGAATKQYVDNTASGIIAKPSVLAATTANLDATYSNGTAGVGATLTSTSNGAFGLGSGNGSGWSLYSGVLVKNQTNKAHNGRYFVSTLGDAGTPWVLTRCGFCDEADEIPGAYIFVQGGLTAGSGWTLSVADPATFVVGTDNINVYQFSGTGTYTAGNGLALTDNQFSADLTVLAEKNNPTFTGTVSGITKSMVGLGAVDNTSDASKPVSTATQTALDLKANLAGPTFTGTTTTAALTATGAITASASGIVFTDGTQSKMGVQSLTPIKTAVAANTTLDALGTDANTRDTLVPISGAYSVTFDTTGNAKYAIGSSIDFYQSSGTGATFVQGSGMTLQYTPGLALRTTYSSATAIKVAATTWLIYGDLKA
jgi:hypothetical protein